MYNLNMSLAGKAKVNKEQIEIIIEFLQKNRELCDDNFSKAKSTKNVAQKLWNDLANNINEKGPPTKTGSEWSKLWITKKNAAHNKIKQSKTRRRSENIIALTSIEKKILTLYNLWDSKDLEESDDVISIADSCYDSDPKDLVKMEIEDSPNDFVSNNTIVQAYKNKSIKVKKESGQENAECTDPIEKEKNLNTSQSTNVKDSFPNNSTVEGDKNELIKIKKKSGKNPMEKEKNFNTSQSTNVKESFPNNSIVQADKNESIQIKEKSGQENVECIDTIDTKEENLNTSQSNEFQASVLGLLNNIKDKIEINMTQLLHESEMNRLLKQEELKLKRLELELLQEQNKLKTKELNSMNKN